MTFVIGERLIDRFEPQPFDDHSDPSAASGPEVEPAWTEASPVAPPWAVDPPTETCDVCRAAELAAKGVVASSVGPDVLHSRCRAPGTCTCGCEYSQGGKCVNCGRTRLFDQLQGDTDGPQCVDRADCAKAMLDAPPPPSTPKNLTKPVSAAPRASRPAKERAPRAPKAPKAAATPKPCTCGCGEMTGGGLYRPGHDARHVKTLVAAVRARGITIEAAKLQLTSDALRDKLTKQLEGK